MADIIAALYSKYSSPRHLYADNVQAFVRGPPSVPPSLTSLIDDYSCELL